MTGGGLDPTVPQYDDPGMQLLLAATCEFADRRGAYEQLAHLEPRWSLVRTAGGAPCCSQLVRTQVEDTGHWA